ncbi:alpha/beta hydrolase fold domain-containing protein [Streptomyces sp. NPDC053560]|uniref:alpha/beta hydrolase fold domain-containing protein n=1 Tax=Streptomyces sp. NPDC053560 TaxID=3365711 RepID=UPI0037D4E5FF
MYDPPPETKYPTQVEQIYAVGQWGARHGSAPNTAWTPRVSAVTGESAGGCMPTVFALMNKERGGIDLKCYWCVGLHSQVRPRPRRAGTNEWAQR